MATSSASLAKPGNRENWIEKTPGPGLPPGIRKVARKLKKLHPEWTLSRCIATAQSMSKKWAAGGSAKGAANVAGMKALQARNKARQVSAATPALDGMVLLLSQSYGADTAPPVMDLAQASDELAEWLDLADPVIAESLRLAEERARQLGKEPKKGKKKFNEAAHPRAGAGSPTGGEFVPAGAARNEQAAAAQKDTGAASNSEKLQRGLLDPSKLTDEQLQKLSRYVYSWKSSDPKVVAARVKVAAELRKRGMDPGKFGSLAGAKPAPKPTPKPKPARKPARTGTVAAAQRADLVQWLDLATERRVRTPAGVKRYHKPVGAVITAGSAAKGRAAKVRTGADYVRAALKSRATREQRADVAADKLVGLNASRLAPVLRKATPAHLAAVEAALARRPNPSGAERAALEGVRSRRAEIRKKPATDFVPDHEKAKAWANRSQAEKDAQRARQQSWSQNPAEAEQGRRAQAEQAEKARQAERDERLAKLTPAQREGVLAARAKRKAQREAEQAGAVRARKQQGASVTSLADRRSAAGKASAAAERPTPDMSTPERLSDAELDTRIADAKVRLRAAFENDPRRSGQAFADAKLYANVMAAEKRRRNVASGAKPLPPTPAERSQARLAGQQQHTTEAAQRRATITPTPAAGVELTREQRTDMEMSEADMNAMSEQDLLRLQNRLLTTASAMPNSGWKDRRRMQEQADRAGAVRARKQQPAPVANLADRRAESTRGRPQIERVAVNTPEATEMIRRLQEGGRTPNEQARQEALADAQRRAAARTSAPTPDADALLGMPSAGAQQAAVARMSVDELRAVDDELTRRGSVSGARRAVAERLASTVEDRRPLEALAADEGKQGTRRTAALDIGAAINARQQAAAPVRKASDPAGKPADEVYTGAHVEDYGGHKLRLTRDKTRGTMTVTVDGNPVGSVIGRTNADGARELRSARAYVDDSKQRPDAYTWSRGQTMASQTPATNPRAVSGTPENIAARQQARARGASQPSMFAGEEEQKLSDVAVRRQAAGTLFEEEPNDEAAAIAEMAPRRTASVRAAEAEAQRARERLQQAEAKVERAVGASSGPNDPNLPLGQIVNRTPRQQQRAGARADADIARTAAAFREREAAERDARVKEAKAHREARDAETIRDVTPETLRSARFIRDKSGSWHQVKKVNAKSVTVPSVVGGSWDDRIPIDKIVEVRA